MEVLPWPFERIPLMERPTPIQRLVNLEKALGRTSPAIFAKRDDLGLLGGGGNKLRKLEFLLGEARRMRATAMIAIGGMQSNFARLAAAACAASGLGCQLVLVDHLADESREHALAGNLLLDQLFGAIIIKVATFEQASEVVRERQRTLEAGGATVIVSELGGSSAVGCLGYADCALEILEQEAGLGFSFDEIIVPNGSSGTQAGLLAGFAVKGVQRAVRGFCVYTNGPETERRTQRLLDQTLALCPGDGAAARIVVDDSQLGGGYGVQTEESKAALKLVARTEGILIDPVYGAKALAGAVARLGERRNPAPRSILVLLTGGTPALFAYASELG